MASLTIFQKNKAALLNRFPEMENDIFNNPPENDFVEYSQSKKGALCAKLNGLALHSLYDPHREAERIIETRTTDSTDCGVFIGFGLGYTIERFMQRFPQADVLVYEPDPGLFLRTLKEKDFSEILQQERIGLLLGSDPSSIATCLQRLNCRDVCSFTLKAVGQSYPDLCGKAEDSILRFLTRRQVNINTLKKFGKRWVKNLCKNLIRYENAISIHHLAGIFKDIPALLIAAGPSLDQGIPHLKKLQKRFLIIAVDTVSRALKRIDLEPDFILSVDPQYWNSRHLDPVKPGKSILITDSAAFPATFRKFNHPYILCPSSFPLAEAIEQKLGITGKLYSGGSVATAAWEVARVLGCPSIHCIGLDLSYPDKQTHYTGSFFEERLHSLSNRISPVSQTNWHIIYDVNPYPVPDNRGGEVLTDKRLSIYHTWFQEQTQNYPDFATFTTSPGGIKMDGVVYIELEKLFQLDEHRVSIDKKMDTIRCRSAKEDASDYVRDTIKTIQDEMTSLKKISEDGIRLNQELMNAFSSGADINPYLTALDQTDRQIIQASGKQIAAFILQPFIYEMTEKKKEASAEKIMEDSRNFYIQLTGALEYHLSLLSE